MLKKIISGAQTGADQAGIDAAIDLGLPYGGYIPRDRRTEVGPLSVKYENMIEVGSTDYRVRTKLNINAAEGTVVFTYGPPTGGSSYTLRYASGRGRRVMHIDLKKVKSEEAMSSICDWVALYDIRSLNVAGSRKSKAPTIYSAVYVIIAGVIGRMGVG